MFLANHAWRSIIESPRTIPIILMVAAMAGPFVEAQTAVPKAVSPQSSGTPVTRSSGAPFQGTVQAPVQPTPDQAARETWRRFMVQVKDTKAGCFKAAYPSKVWESIPCSPAKHFALSRPAGVRPAGVRPAGAQPKDVGNTCCNDYELTSSAPITSVVGSFTEVDDLTSEAGPETGGGANVPNLWSLQVNTNTWPSSVCNAATLPGCLGWEQFGFTSKGELLVQDWLIGFGAGDCPAGAWEHDSKGSVNCVASSLTTNAPAQSFTDLGKITLEGRIDPGGYDSATATTPNGDGLYKAVFANSTLALTDQWRYAEFNIFGYQGGAYATFNDGSFLKVKVGQDDGTQISPTCATDGNTSTGEASNMTISDQCYQARSPYLGIQFLESVAPIVTSVSPNVGSVAGGTLVTILGAGFTKNMEAAFGNHYVGMTCPSTNECTAYTPRVPMSEKALVTVTNLTPTGEPGGFSAYDQNVYYLFLNYPEGTMQPHAGPPAGGTLVTISGENFSTTPGATQVSFNFKGVMTPASDLSCSSATTCTMTTPPDSLGNATDVVPVTMTVDGMSSPIGGFTYQTPTPKPPKPSCQPCIDAGGKCTIVNGKPVCKGTLH